jgi:hypothetical protein
MESALTERDASLGSSLGKDSCSAVGAVGLHGIAKGAIAADTTFWRDLREDFEGLQPAMFSLIWSTQLPMSLDDQLLQSQWTWWHFPDESLRARLRAIALKGARALGGNSEDAWFDALREADFVKFKLSGEALENQPDGSMLESRSGSIRDVVKHSITLCHILETRAAGAFSKATGIGMRAAGDSERTRNRSASSPEFPKRALWLRTRLQERSWNEHDVGRHRGPDRKTVQKILNGQRVREDVLERLATALSSVSNSKKLPKVGLLEIPRD